MGTGHIQILVMHDCCVECTAENVTVTTVQGKFICRGIINYDGTVTVCTIE